jgi:hypothetical protein
VARERHDDRSQPNLWASIGAEAVQPPEPGGERSTAPARAMTTPHPVRATDLWDKVFSQANIARALRRVERNGGAPGPDGMTTADPYVEAPLARDPPPTRPRHLPTPARPPG